MVGRRDLQPIFIEGFVRALGLSADDATCFGLLVRCAHPISSADRLQAGRELKQLQQRHGAPAPAPRRGRPRKEKSASTERGGAPAYTDWYHPVIRALACCPGFQQNPTWIASSLRPAISPLQVSSLQRSEPELLEARPTLPLTLQYAPETRAYHRQALRTARWALHNVDRSEREMAALTTSLFPEQYARLREEILRFQEEIESILARAAQPGYVERIAAAETEHLPASTELRHGAPDLVYQLTIQVFPLSKRI